MLGKIISFFKDPVSTELPEGHVWCFICNGFGTDDGICPCQACEGEGYLPKSEVENKKKELFPQSQ